MSRCAELWSTPWPPGEWMESTPLQPGDPLTNVDDPCAWCGKRYNGTGGFVRQALTSHEGGVAHIKSVAWIHEACYRHVEPPTAAITSSRAKPPER